MQTKPEITNKSLDQIKSTIRAEIDTLTLEKDEQVSRRYETTDQYQHNLIEHRIVNLDRAMDALDEAINQINKATGAIRCAEKHGWQ